MSAALEHQQVVRVYDLHTDSRWPAFSAAVAELGIRSMLSFQLYTSESGKGKPLSWIPTQDIERAQEALIAFGAVKSRQPVETFFTNEFVPGS